MISSLLWQSFQPRERGGTNNRSGFSLTIPMVNWALLHWVIAVPCGINNTGGTYCPCAGHSIGVVVVGGRPFTQSSRVSGAADSGLTQGSLLLCPCTRLNCQSARLEDNSGRLHSPGLAPLVRLPPHPPPPTNLDESQLNEKLVGRRHWTVPEQRRCPGRD